MSRNDSRTTDAGSAGNDSGTVGRRSAVSGTGSFGARGRRKKRGFLHRTGITIPAAFLAVLLVVVVWGAAKVMNPQGTGANSLFRTIDGLGNSRSVTMLAQEQQTLVSMTNASKVLTTDAVPAYTDPDQIIAAQHAAASAAASAAESGGTSVTTMPVPADPSAAQATARAMLADFGFSSSQWSCLYSLWERESTWNVYAENPASGAYGIPQALPGYKMASAGADWQTDATTQIRWGLGYIQQVYGTPCTAWAHEEADGYY